MRDAHRVQIGNHHLTNLMIQQGDGIQTKEVVMMSNTDLDFFCSGD